MAKETGPNDAKHVICAIGEMNYNNVLGSCCVVLPIFELWWIAHVAVFPTNNKKSGR